MQWNRFGFLRIVVEKIGLQPVDEVPSNAVSNGGLFPQQKPAKLV